MEARAKIRLSLLVLCWCGVVAIQAQPPSPSPPCRSISLMADLEVNDDFEQNLGSGLVLRVKSLKEPGWFVDVVPAAKPNDDYVYPVNPPLRFNGKQTLGPGYGEDVKSSLGYPHEMRFLLNPTDYDRVSSLIGNILWPYQTSTPDQARKDYSAALDSVRTGWLELTVLHYKTDSGGALKSIQFRAQVVVPSDFELAKDLEVKQVACPSKADFP
jgi:hypothetical protein